MNLWVIFPFILSLSQPLTKDLGLVHVSTTRRDLERALNKEPLKMIKGLKNDTYNKMLGNFFYLAWQKKMARDSWIVIQVYECLNAKE